MDPVKLKGRTNSNTAIRREIKELLGKEFRTVKDGIDPNEVMAFLETVVGSSETALKHLEKMISLHRLSQTMEKMVEETRQVSEYIKGQVEQEAEATKAKIIEEAQCKAEEIVGQAKKSWNAAIENSNSLLLTAQSKAEEVVDQTQKSRSALIETTNSVILEAITKAREMEEMAFQTVKDIVDTSTESAQQSIPDVINSVIRKLNLIYEQYISELSTLQSKGVETSLNARDQETVRAEEHVPELPKVDERERTPDNTPEPNLTGVSMEAEKAPLSVEAQAAAPKEISPIMYSGEVVLAISPQAGLPWMELLRQRLRNIGGVTILLDAGTSKGGGIMKLSLVEPIPLTSILLEMPKVEKLLGGHLKVEDQNVEEYSGGFTKILSHYGPKGGAQPTMLAVIFREE